MTPTRVPMLVVVAAVCAVLAWLVLRLVYTALPPLPWTAVPALLIAAIAEAWSGREVRARILRRPGTKPVAPIYVARLVALAKATAQVAAIVAGIAAGFVCYLAGFLSAATPRQDAITAGAGLAASILLAAAALYLENCCRVPPNPGDPGRNMSLRSADHFH